MWRFLSNLLTLLSTVLLIATVALWVRTPYATDYAEFVGLDSYVTGSTMPGRVQGKVLIDYGLVNFFGDRPGRPSYKFDHSVIPSPTDWRTLTSSNFDTERRWGPFWLATYSARGMDGRTIRGVYVSTPLWFPAAVFAVLPTWWVIRRRRRKAAAEHACPGCGYDLRATPDRCPECGRVSKSN
ncbi:MAG TPA: hypothetical protein VEA69_24435 [Tepidisphaeraceae bacterium]|nr:hypothetical protein [Tepidisphaeraceae bacterium]